MRSTQTALPQDLQETRPAAAIGLSSAGVTRSAKVIRIRHDGAEVLFHAEVTCVSDLSPERKGVHMSRFEEIVNEAIDEVVIGEALRIEALAERIAAKVVESQRARRSQVTIQASYPVEKRTPVTDIPTQEMYGLIGIGAAGPGGARRLVGATAQGMNACPCAQGLLQSQAEEALAGDGFSPGEIERIVSLVPIATHNQRARGTLYLGTTDEQGIDADVLLEIVEGSMSSEIYELLKRPDERYVVDKAHRRPRFVEDSVREMIRAVVERFPSLPDDAFVRAHQVNFETIHTHDVVAERWGTVGEIRGELTNGGRPLARHTTLEDWLSA
jgi:GTP cyclohydrolase I/GTP cyclohydrolase-4